MSFYQPHLMRIEEITDETSDIRTLRLLFLDTAVANGFAFKAGQFGEYSVFGAGECALSFASAPTRKGYIEITVQAVGKVTRAIRYLNVGDTMGFRGPYGNGFPIDEMRGKNLVLIAGGIGLAPVRSMIWNALDLRDQFGQLHVFYSARSVPDLMYKRELEQWAARADLNLYRCVDPGGESYDWKGEVCFLPTLVEKVSPSSENSYAVVCGPPMVVSLTLQLLERLGFPSENIYTTLQTRMKCGVGKCGRCNIGPLYVCKDGPVFSFAQLKSLPSEY
jgi:NAD(P)H-flavin reductase